MANIIEPENILAELIRTTTDEPTRTGLSSRISSTTQLFDGDNTTTEFTLSQNLSSITSITVNSTTQQKYLDFQIDTYNNKITFTNAPSNGTDNIEINYKYGTNWIYGDKPRIDLSRSSYPRITVIKLIENSEPQGTSEDDTFDIITFQVDIITYNDMVLTTSRTDAVEGHEAAVEISRNVKNNIKNNWRTQIANKMFDPRFINLYTVPFEQDKGLYRQILEVSFKSYNIGE